MSELPLDQAVTRLQSNEDRFDQFVNGGPTDSYITRQGQQVPSVQKFLAESLDEKADASDLTAEATARANADTALSNQIAAKANDNAVVKTTGNQTVAGQKTFSTAPVVPDSSFSIAKTTGLQAALDAKADASALAAKANDNAVVKTTGNQTVAGQKTFSTAPVVPDSSFSIAKTTGLQAALDAKAAASALAGKADASALSAKADASALTAETAARVAADNDLADALAAKADDNAVVKTTGNQTVAGQKTFSTAPVVPDSSFSIAKTTGLQAALDGKADAFALQQEVQSRVTFDLAISDSVAALEQGLASKADSDAMTEEQVARSNADEAISNEIKGVSDEVIAARGNRPSLAEAIAGGGSLATPLKAYPGEVPDLYSSSLDSGSAVTAPILQNVDLVQNDEGAAVRVQNRGIVAARQYFRVNHGRTYALTIVLRRTRNSEDPSDDTVRAALACYSASKSRLTGANASRVLQDFDQLTVSSGRQTVYVTVARSGTADIILPAGCRHIRPFVQQFGVSAEIEIEFMEWTDITDTVTSLGLEVDVYGLLSERSAYNNESAGFVFVATDGDNLNAYIRKGSAGSWIGPYSLRGAAGPAGASVEIDLWFTDFDEMQDAAPLFSAYRGANLWIEPDHPLNGSYMKVGDIGEGTFDFVRELTDIEIARRVTNVEGSLSSEVATRQTETAALFAADAIEFERASTAEEEAKWLGDRLQTAYSLMRDLLHRTVGVDAQGYERRVSGTDKRGRPEWYSGLLFGRTVVKEAKSLDRKEVDAWSAPDSVGYARKIARLLSDGTFVGRRFRGHGGSSFGEDQSTDRQTVWKATAKASDQTLRIVARVLRNGTMLAHRFSTIGGSWFGNDGSAARFIKRIAVDASGRRRVLAITDRFGRTYLPGYEEEPLDDVEYMVEFNTRMQRIADGQIYDNGYNNTNGPLQVPIMVLADSFGHTSIWWVGAVTKRLKRDAGDGGPGAIGIVRAAGGEPPYDLTSVCADATGYAVRVSDGWTKTNYLTPVLSAGILTASSAANFIIAGTDAPPIGEAELVFEATADGLMEGSWGLWNHALGLDVTWNHVDRLNEANYTWGSWADIDVSGTPGAVGRAAVPGWTNASELAEPNNWNSRNQWAFRARWKAGTVKPGYVDVGSSNVGVRVDRMGQGGQQLYHLAQMAATPEWKAALAATKVRSVILCAITNDQTAKRGLKESEANLRTVLDAIHEALPLADRFVIGVAENQRTNNFIPMRHYRRMMERVCRLERVTYLSIQHAAGQRPSDYKQSARKYFLDQDEVHMETYLGFRGAFAGAVLRKLRIPYF